MKEILPHPRDRGVAGPTRLNRAAIVFILAILVTTYAPSGGQCAPAAGTKPPASGAAPAFAIPKDLPSKGSAGAKLGMVLFTEFH